MTFWYNNKKQRYLRFMELKAETFKMLDTFLLGVAYFMFKQGPCLRLILF